MSSYDAWEWIYKSASSLHLAFLTRYLCAGANVQTAGENNTEENEAHDSC